MTLDVLDGDARTETVASRIRSAMDRLSAKERQVARVVLAQYPAAGLETTTALSSLAKVSGPTVIRFVSRLGYRSYREFQTALRDELVAKTASPLTKSAPSAAQTATGEFRATAAGLFAEGVRRTLAEIPDAEFDRAVALLADQDARVHILGGRFTRLAAEYFAIHLQALRPGCHIHPDARAAATVTPDLRRRDCVVAFDFRRYQADTIALVRLARARRASVVLITDPWMSPIAEMADVVLTAKVDAVSAFDSHVCTVALVETLIGALQGRLRDTFPSRMRELEQIRASLEPQA
ncbi:MurR/RpiR family transcriptional regulator [Micromonospora sp. NPDC048830]|uniref:MurR/RpiR family transcriptional regulator n=1 Tax=Micromonospora sp. NPDC048830 TaxID=3364257 RepID=UPI003717A751